MASDGQIELSGQLTLPLPPPVLGVVFPTVGKVPRVVPLTPPPEMILRVSALRVNFLFVLLLMFFFMILSLYETE
jgi:hypothetical protein